MCTQFNDGFVYNPATFSMALVTKSGTQYLLKIENLTKFRAWARTLTEGSFKIFKRVYGGAGINIKPDNTNEQNEKSFLLYLKSNGGSGLKLFSGNANFTEWKAKVLDNNNNVVTVPCVE